MPHIILECSDNIIEGDLSKLLVLIQDLLVQTLPTALDSCKSRVIRHKEYVVGNNNKKNAFVHLSILILKGRKPEILQKAAELILLTLNNFFRQSTEKLNVGISLSIDDLPELYIKNK